MGKTTRFNCAFLEVELERRHIPSSADEEVKKQSWIDAAEAARDAIKRHCDGVGYVEIKHDTDDLCEHCGSYWTANSDTYNGGCCAEDEKNSPEALAAARKDLARQEFAKRATEIARELRASGMGCNCDLDRWEPERSTGHSRVCRIHKAAVAKARAEATARGEGQ